MFRPGKFVEAVLLGIMVWSVMSTYFYLLLFFFLILNNLLSSFKIATKIYFQLEMYSHCKFRR